MMRVRALEMGLFGLFSDRTIDFGEREDGQPDFHLIHGPNESGKTTLMEGYLRLLYGFPLRDPYGFKHQRANLRVRGVLEIDGEAHDLTRGSARSGNLRNVQGLPASEGLLQAALRGIGIDDYRKLLCLNDASIEEGGEEIVNSEGEIGRLLFSAAAGISDLSPVLDDVKARAEDFYRKGGSRQRYAQLARELKALLESIREEDVSASEYRALRDALANAGQKEREARDERQRLTRWRVRLEAIVAAHPVVRRLRSCEEALATPRPLSPRPRHRSGRAREDAAGAGGTRLCTGPRGTGPGGKVSREGHSHASSRFDGAGSGVRSSVGHEGTGRGRRGRPSKTPPAAGR